MQQNPTFADRWTFLTYDAQIYVTQFGDSFTLTLASVKMTFLFEPSHIDFFFSAPDEKVTFRPAVEQFTQRVFGLTSRLFFPLHSKMLTELRHLLVPGALAERMETLGTRALQLLPCYVHHAQVDLYSLCRGLVFHCAVEAMFGRRFVEQLPELLGLGNTEDEEEATEELRQHGGEGNVEAGTATWQAREEELRGTSFKAMGDASVASVWVNAAWEGWERQRRPSPRPPAGVERLARVFFTFEERFELAASPLPHVFQTEFVQSRWELLRLFRQADGRGLFKDTPAGQLLDRTTGLPPHLRPNLLLALLWASQVIYRWGGVDDPGCRLTLRRLCNVEASGSCPRVPKRLSANRQVILAVSLPLSIFSLPLSTRPHRHQVSYIRPLSISPPLYLSPSLSLPLSISPLLYLSFSRRRPTAFQPPSGLPHSCCYRKTPPIRPRSSRSSRGSFEPGR
ncbi:hypothetical protein Vretifemale_13735 [Volvox reticuliferus]|uniref:Uncharacterized protein n=1 Tax=Volvox reticuliferus TaxID=1737510 RepID=A0A8J4FUR7_9CHLO|nr:hypothetical protein Vretifemale_13735 [Volvox reticuliferus]